jgi:acyl-CoA reductase-like NAD-dependent aldehyde dehydrogenase
MHEEMMVGFRRRRTQSRSGWETPRPTLVASDVVSSRLVVGPVAAAVFIGGALGLTAVVPDDIVPIANDTTYGLAAGVFTRAS